MVSIYLTMNEYNFKQDRISPMASVIVTYDTDKMPINENILFLHSMKKILLCKKSKIITITRS